MTCRLLFVFDMDDVLYDYDWRDRMAGSPSSPATTFAELRRRWWNDDGRVGGRGRTTSATPTRTTPRSPTALGTDISGRGVDRTTAARR